MRVSLFLDTAVILDSQQDALRLGNCIQSNKAHGGKLGHPSNSPGNCQQKRRSRPATCLEHGQTFLLMKWRRHDVLSVGSRTASRILRDC